MTATVEQVCKAALRGILVQAADAALEPDEYSDAIFALNNFMADLEANGTVLGFTSVTNVADEVTVPAGAMRGIIANLAIEIAPDYNGMVSPALAESARTGLITLKRLGAKKITSSLPANLPKGGGNIDCGYPSTEFYGLESYCLVTLSGNARETEITAIDTPVRVDGFWTQQAAKQMSGDINGTIRSLADGVTLSVTLSITATGDSDYTFRVMKNGVSAIAYTSALSATPATLLITGSLTLSRGDYVELWVENDAGTESAVVTDARFEVA